MSLPPIDELMAMDEDQLAELKKTELNELLTSVSEDRAKRLTSLQWRVDTAISRAPNKLAGAIEVSQMMNDSFEQMRQKLNELREVCDGVKTNI